MEEGEVDVDSGDELAHLGNGTDQLRGSVGCEAVLASRGPRAFWSGGVSAGSFRSGSPRDTNLAEAVRLGSCSLQAEVRKPGLPQRAAAPTVTGPKARYQVAT